MPSVAGEEPPYIRAERSTRRQAGRLHHLVGHANEDHLLEWRGGAANDGLRHHTAQELRGAPGDAGEPRSAHDPSQPPLALDRLTSAILNARRRGTRVAALFIDVDRFKRINDTLGHATGDRLLRQVAQRIRSAVREEDSVARLGGDEFIVVLPEVRQRADAEAVAYKIVQAAARPFFLDGHEAFVTVSIGVSVFPDDGQDAAEMMRHADAALYVAKETAAALSASSLPSCANATTTACAWKPICDMRWNATS